MLPRAFRRIAAQLALALGLVLAMPSTFGEITSESQLKAAYLVNFLKYVEWPGTRSTVSICLFGRDSLGPYLASYEGRQIIGRELRIRKVSTPDQLTDCQVLFIPDTEEARIGAILRWVDRQPILTVSDVETFVRDGGAIALIRNDGRLQFDVNADAIGRANLKASSQMLRLARQVTGAAR
ncbi:YfiR family protein [Dechloromonas sp. CZR5]|uniref:YfiR family protein n=1 Tax=Dechloromonas sp. CZR5 TaxID=2608630 RepID=UPI00123D797F|nr:YfiR family protein [Dechloromonas sp. CZR5]